MVMRQEIIVLNVAHSLQREPFVFNYNLLTLKRVSYFLEK